MGKMSQGEKDNCNSAEYKWSLNLIDIQSKLYALKGALIPKYLKVEIE